MYLSTINFRWRTGLLVNQILIYNFQLLHNNTGMPNKHTLDSDVAGCCDASGSSEVFCTGRKYHTMCCEWQER